MSETADKPPSRLMFRIRGVRRVPGRLRQRFRDFLLHRAKARHRRGRPGPKTKQAVFLVGCQRSGTDMSLYVLDRCMDVDGFNEDHPSAFVRCRLKPSLIIERLVERSGAPHVVFKPVCDSHRVAALLDAHQPSRAVWLYRDYRDVANSSVNRWGDFNLRHLRDLSAGGGSWGWSQWNREWLTEDAMAEVREAVNEGLTPFGAAAIYWYLQNRYYFTQDLSQRGDVGVFRYRDLVTRPREEFGRMCAFLGIGFTEAMATAVHARSVHKGRTIDLDPRIRELCDRMLARLDVEAERFRRHGDT